MNDRSAGTQVSYNGTSVHNGNNIESNTNNYFFGNSMPISQTKKRYTNKKLIVPFTKEASNGAQGGTYVQRDDLLGKISESFEAQAGKKRMVFLSGMGGCGKSELARAYAEGHSEEYDEIFWLTCRDGVRPELFSLMADANTLEEVGKKDAYAFSDKVLIIVDNCNSDDWEFLFSVEHSTGDADILISTRLSTIGSYKDFLIPVESDDRESFAYSVFRNNYCKKPKRGNTKKINDSDIPSVYAICREVQYNTMIVSLIGIRLREYDDLSISVCAKKVREGVGKLDGKVRYGKDLDSRPEEIKDILVFLFADILKHNFSDEEKAVLTVLSLTPASWYEIDYIVSLCKGTGRETDYIYAVEELLDLGWLQGNGDSLAIHPLIAEVITDKQITTREPKFFEGLLENYLGMPDQYLSRERFLMNKILTLGVEGQLKYRLAVMLLINHGGYKKLFTELFPEVRAAYFVYASHDGRRLFLYRDLEKEETCPLIDVPCLDEEGEQAELLKVINKGVPYNLDLSVLYYGKEIEKVPDGLCRNDHFLRNLIFSKKLTNIGDGAFSGCSGLSGELELPKGLTSIGDGAFCDCSGLSGGLELPERLTSIGVGAFSGCSGLSGKLDLPESLMSIGKFAFSGCGGLSGGLELPERLTSIGDYAFYNCSGLRGGLNLPESLTSIGDYAFYNCSGLRGGLNLPESLTSIGVGAFSGCSGLSGKLELPESLTSIRESAFSGCSGLSGGLELPEGLTSIGDYAFTGCSGLSGELELPENLTSIGEFAFYDCSGLSGGLELPEGLTSIGDYAFSDCSGLSGELELPEGLTSIGVGAFSGCSGLSGELELPENLTSIGEFAFYDCNGFSGGLELPENLTSIGDYAFSDCSGLSGELELPEGLTSIGDYAFSGCSGLSGELELPEGLTSIGDYAFSGCSGLSGELELPEGLTSIGDYAFSGCSGLSGELELPESLTSIGAYAFAGCSGLSGELELPEGLTSIGVGAFSDFSGLSGELELPEDLTSIEDFLFDVCGGLSGELELPEGLTSIGDFAFDGCSGLRGELELPEGLTSIGDYAFRGCSGLSGELELPEGLTSIGDGVFDGCSGLSGELDLPESLTSIGVGAFSDCSGLSGELDLPESLTSIGAYAFAGCSGLSGELDLPESLTSIGDGAFYNCDALEKITFYNPSTEIQGPLNLFTSTIICGYRNSTAEEYAKMQGLVFEELEE